MEKITAGFLFVASAILFSSRYIITAILCTGENATWENFKMIMKDVGTPLLVASIIALLLGVIYLIRGEINGKKAK